ncbi:hypothetical protein AOA12_03595 [Microbacterium sp. No. 7]|nr:hypothetical protein AOA12_03595 [Microbacterium sp. No. 7]
MEASAQTLSALRLPVVAPRTLLGLLAVVEILIALGILLAPPTLIIAAIGATAFSAAFLLVVVRAYRLGSREDCGCFGESDHSRIGPALIVRNAVLLVVSAFLLALALTGATGVPGVVQSLGAGDAGALLSLAAAAAAAALAWAVLRARATAPVGADGEAVPAAQPPPASTPSLLVLSRESGKVLDLASRARLRAQLAIFVKPGCGSCTQVMAHLDEHADAVRAVAEVSVIAGVAAFESVESVASADPRVTALDIGGLVGNRLADDSQYRPIAALLATDGSVVEPVAIGRDQVIELIDVLRAVTEEQA